ncbi:DNA polymerase IV, partial [Bifidobacterium aemilianum]
HDWWAVDAAVQTARHPGLAGPPATTGTGDRAVGAAANYEARTYGISSAMPAARAHQLCPNGSFLPVDMAYYRMMSRRIFDEVFRQVTDQIEQVSVDEGDMDVSHALLTVGQPIRIGTWIRPQVATREGIHGSAGKDANKRVDQMASSNAKQEG